MDVLNKASPLGLSFIFSAQRGGGGNRRNKDRNRADSLDDINFNFGGGDYGAD